MKQYIYRPIRVLVMLLATVVSLTGCVDDMIDNGVIGEGEAIVDMSLCFNVFTEVDVNTRSAGTSLDNINDLHVFVYDNNGHFIMARKIDDYNVETRNLSADEQQTASTSETKVTKATFKIQNLAYGKYRMYAVVNMGVDFLDRFESLTADADGKGVTLENSTPEDLMAIPLVWDNTNLAANGQMLGAFRNGADSKYGEGASDPYVTVNATRVSVHSWVKRAASKVTVAFDTKKLNKDVNIYIQSVRVRDIRRSTTLGTTAMPDAPQKCDLISEGEQVDYSSLPGAADAGNGNRGLLIYNGFNADNYYGSHSHASEAVFFYENRQPDGPKDCKLQDADRDGIVDDDLSVLKDDSPYGTYLEVQAYYKSTAPGNAVEGPITYRFMLGANERQSFDVQRNHHYKVTMSFNGNANDVDWHIDFGGGKYTIAVPTPFYISYGYGEMVDLPIEVNGLLKQDGKIKVEIVQNHWFPYGASASEFWSHDILRGNGIRNHYDETPWNGFLTLRNTNYVKDDANAGMHSSFVGRARTLSVGASDPTGLDYLYKYWYGVPASDPIAQNEFGTDNPRAIPNQGFREFPASPTGGKVACPDGDGDEYSVVQDLTDEKTYITIPLYTRALFLVKALGYSGNNPYYTYMRQASLKITLTFNDGTEKIYPIDIKQVRRIVNPKGIYRRAGNNTPFHVVMTHRAGEDSPMFETFESQGTWTAEVESETGNFITLNGRKKIESYQGVIDFHVNFIPGTNSDDSPNRYAVILVKYHSGTCKHRILVRQGYEPDLITERPSVIQDAGSQNGTKYAYWHACNLRTGKITGSEPVDEGSMFRYDNLSVAVDAASNIEANKFLAAGDNPFWIIKPGKAAELGNWSDVVDMYPSNSGGKVFEYDDQGFPMNIFNKDIPILQPDATTVNAEVPQVEDWIALRDDPVCEYTFGVLYADGATESHMVDAFDYIYSNPETSDHGMRGIFVYNKETSHNIFFPIGASAFGRRQGNHVSRNVADNNSTDGVLRYAGRSGYMPESLAEKMPPYWNIHRNGGAIYWVQPKVSTVKDIWGDNDKGEQKDIGSVAHWDINYSTFDFNFYNASQSLKFHSDAAYIRLVERQPRTKSSKVRKKRR